MANGFTDEDDALLAELGVEVNTKKQVSRTPREERIIAGFEEIQRLSMSTAAARSMARIATSSSACMQSALTGSASYRNAAT